MQDYCLQKTECITGEDNNVCCDTFPTHALPTIYQLDRQQQPMTEVPFMIIIIILKSQTILGASEFGIQSHRMPKGKTFILTFVQMIGIG